MKLLVVEDDKSVAAGILQLLETSGHSVENCTTGTCAISRTREEAFDLILLDIFLPDIRGYDLIPRIRAVRPDIGIIAMTGYNSRELEAKVRAQGILYYMVIPFETRTLRDLVDHIERKSSFKNCN